VRRSDLQLITETRRRARDGTARQLRQQTRLTQAQIAATLGVARSTVAMWETGAATPSEEHALAYGRLLRWLAGMAKRGI
jgi:DNA-binding transcriptional regulator YiaG